MDKPRKKMDRAELDAVIEKLTARCLDNLRRAQAQYQERLRQEQQQQNQKTQTPPEK